MALFLLRATAGGALLAQGVSCARHHAELSWIAALGGVLVLDGLALLAGSLTPAAAAMGAALLAAGILAPSSALGGLGADAARVPLLAMAVAVGLLGPGAYSVDARLFGRREIVVPRA